MLLNQFGEERAHWEFGYEDECASYTYCDVVPLVKDEIGSSWFLS